MRDIIEQEAEITLQRMSDLGVIGGTQYAYYQGKIDTMAWILRQLEEAKV